MIRRLRYYLASIPTLLKYVENWYILPTLAFRKQPAIIVLRTGHRFKVRSLMDAWIVKETCLDHDYEANSVPIENGWTILDIGAGIGDFSISVAKEHPQCQVYAFEPFPSSFHLLQENLELNHITNVTAFPIAVGPAVGKGLLATTGEAVQHTTTHSLLPNTITTVEVQVLSLEALLRLNNLRGCDFLKMDCEGCEFEALLHASPQTLAGIRHICLEYHDKATSYSHSDLVHYLQSHGFQTRITPNPVHHHLGLLYAGR